jgi:hypothetical protein
MAIGQIVTLPSDSARLIVSQSREAVSALAMLNPNDGVCYIKLNGPAGTSPSAWDWKLPSQSYGLFPGPWQSLGIFYQDQSGSGRQAEINVYDSTQRLIVPDIHSIGRAVQVSGTTMDITQGEVPSNPPLNSVRLWADASGNIHVLESTGNDATILDSSNYGTTIIAGGDASGPIGALKVTTTHIATGVFAWAQNTSLVDKRWFSYTGDGYTSFHCGDTGFLIVNQANTLRLLNVDNASGMLNASYGVTTSGPITINTSNLTINNPDGTGYGNQIYKRTGPVSGGYFNDGSHLNLQSPDGYSPRIGFHIHGVIGYVLYVSGDADNPFHIMSHTGYNYPIATTNSTQTLQNKNLKWTYIVPGNGAVLSYACFHILQTGGGTYYMPASDGHAGEMIIAKNWVGSAVTLACQGGNVFGIGGGTGAPQTLVLQYGTSYTFMSDGGAGWMVV